MTRLDSFIRRLEAQRACLDHAIELICNLPGPVLEIGLGNGRTYDHLRAWLPDREIFVFDRQFAAHPDCMPDAAHAIQGDIMETLPSAGGRIGAAAALAHVDIGSGDVIATAALATVLGPALSRLLQPGAIVVSDQALRVSGWHDVALPERVAAGRYFMYRA